MHNRAGDALSHYIPKPRLLHLIQNLHLLLRLQKELDRINTKLQDSEEQRIQSEHCVHDLKTFLDSKEREVSASTQKMQDLLLAASGTSTTIKQLEEHVQRLEIDNTRLEAAAKQQTKRTEALQKDMQASAQFMIA